MPGLSTQTPPPVSHDRSPVPIDQILDARVNFANLPLRFELLLEVQEVWRGLDLCAQIARLGLHVIRLNYQRSGCILLQLRDDVALDPRVIDDLFAAAPQVAMLRWTIEVGRSD